MTPQETALLAASPRPRYYVYAYSRADGTPYYVGKGQRDRAFQKNRSVPVPSVLSRIQFVASGMTEIDALCLEVLLIFIYGRKDNGTGILRNLTDGGEGMSGHSPSAETRRKKSEQRKGKKFGAEFGRKVSEAKKGRTFVSLDQRAAISRAMKGRPLREEHRRRVAEAKRSHPTRHFGANNGRSVLSPPDIVEIRAGRLNEREANFRWGISKTQFYRVKRGEQWTTA